VTKDLYQILGVKETASADEIKKAYRDLAKKFHPDRTGGDKSKESRFKDISAAYDILSDTDKRRKYDAMRAAPYGGVASDVDFEDLFGAQSGFSFSFGGGGISDLFGQVFREARQQQQQRGGRRGPPPGGGSRVVFESGGRAPSWAQAPAAEEEIRTREGHVFLRKGNDVHLDVPISVEEAVTGAKVEVPTLSGKVTVTIPPGSSSGRRLRLKGKGIGGGDQYVVVQIVVPEQADERARELIREFSRRAPVKPRR
jgi:curved DNA-binding protein